MGDSWKFNTIPCPKDWPHPSHRWTKSHRPGDVETVLCPGIPGQPDPGEDRPAEPLLRAIYDSWKADGHKVTMETGKDGKPRIRIHPPGEWRPLDVPDQPDPDKADT